MEAYIIDAVRTPTGKKKGALSSIRGDELATIPVKAVLERTGAPADQVEDLILGCVTPIGEQGWNLGRQIALLADLPLTVCGTTINRMCGSGLQAINWAAQGIMSGTHDLLIAAGTEMMSRVPMGSDGGDFAPGLAERYEVIPQHLSAERIAAKWGISRSACDQYALDSHRRASKAWVEGHFAKEVVPAGGLSTDETVRPGTTYDQMAGLVPLFPDGIIHAGISSPICDGAAAALLASEAKVKELGLKPRAKIRAMAIEGVDPTMMLHGVIPVTQKVLKKAGLTLDDIDLFEVNEAFAPVPIAWMKELGVSHEKLNVNGGAIALGHPLGASGVRITATLLSEMERRDAQFGLATMCIGWGMAIATIFERV